MFNRGLLSALALAATASLSAPAAAHVMGAQTEIGPQPASQAAKRRRLLSSIGALPPKYRNRWKACKPKRRPNRLHVSRRAKLRHRRARRAA